VVSGASSSSAVADAAGNYTLTVTGSNGCVDTDIVAVTNTTNYPIADAGSPGILDCNNASISLDGTGSDAGATISYSWSTTSGNIVSAGTSTSPVVNSNAAYVLTVTNVSNGCVSTDQTTVTYDTITPVISLSSSSFIIDCNNTTATFDASATSGTGNSFAWSTSNGFIVSGATSDSPVVNSDGTYNLIVTSSNGCSNIANTDINVTYDTVTPTIVINQPDTLHCNQSQITIDASNSSSGLTYTWATIDGTFVSGDQSSTPIVNNIGTYYLNAVAANGCQNTDSITVIDNENPMAFAIADVTEGEVDLDVVFSDTSTGLNLTYLWDFGNGDTDTISPSNYTFTEVQIHEVVLTVTDQFGCSHSDTLEINALELSAVEVPNIFTPNGDGDNDYFNVRGGGIKNITGNVMNRWGQIVYEWDSQYGGWDGYSVAGNEASEGTYFFFVNIDFNDGHSEEHSGHFMLKR
jgi:gliding motility-associated-like protein